MKKYHWPLRHLLLLTTLLLTRFSWAQLPDATQIMPIVPGGQIAKSLQEQVGAGHGDVQTPLSSVYLIKRDPARAIRRGRQIFQRKFTAEQGLGPRVNGNAMGNIRQLRELGAGLVDSCAGCHGRPRGSAGFGGDVVTRPDSRDSPHLFGLGLQEQLAEEITAELRALRDIAIARVNSGSRSSTQKSRFSRTVFQSFSKRDRQRDSRDSNTRDREGNFNSDGSYSVALRSKGIDYGILTAGTDGSLDFSRVEGIDNDLRVKPFFHQGGTISIREFVVGAFNAEMGLQAPDALLCAVTEPGTTITMTSPSGFVFDPTQDTFERPPVCSESEDRDGDGISNEIPMAIIDHMEFYLLNYFKPGLGRQTRRTREGLAIMASIGCTSCHIQNLRIDSDRRVADVETVYDPLNGIFNRLFATAETRFVAFEDGFIDPFDGATHPQLLPEGRSFVVENIFTDFKRHDLGAFFHEREYDDVETRGTSRVTHFMTEPLWGVGSTAPYGHDGRSINLEEVILRHGGEAERERRRFARLDDDDRAKVLEFLATLILFPPDDTASTLNPGNPQTDDPQTPSEHGSINLGALFQLPYEGGE